MQDQYLPLKNTSKSIFSISTEGTQRTVELTQTIVETTVATTRIPAESGLIIIKDGDKTSTNLIIQDGIIYQKLNDLTLSSINSLSMTWFKSPYTWTRRLKPLILQLSMKVFESLAEVFPNPD